MSNIFVIEQDLLEKFFSRIEVLLIEKRSEKPAKKAKSDLTSEELEKWVPLYKAWAILDIKKNQWYGKYQKEIKHTTYSGKTWVYLPSILKFLESRAIN